MRRISKHGCGATVLACGLLFGVLALAFNPSDSSAMAPRTSSKMVGGSRQAMTDGGRLLPGDPDSPSVGGLSGGGGGPTTGPGQRPTTTITISGAHGVGVSGPDVQVFWRNLLTLWRIVQARN